MKTSMNEVLARCAVLFSIFLTINIGVGSYFLCFHWYLKEDVTRVKFGTRTQTTIL